MKLTVIFLEYTKSDLLSLKIPCLYILRPLFYLVRTLEGYKRPFVHPTKELDLQYMLNLMRCKDYSVVLFMVVRSLPHMVGLHSLAYMGR